MSHKLNATLVAAALFAAPFVVLWAAGALEPRALPVAALLGAVAVALAAYLASAVALVPRRRFTAASSATARPALGGC